MATETINIPSQIVVQTAAQWAADATVYSAKHILVTSDAFYGTPATNVRKIKIADGTNPWSAITYFPGADLATVGLIVLSTFSAGANTAVTNADTLAGALAKFQGQINARATLSSPALTGTPTAPTAAQGNNSTQISTTAYVDAAVAAAVTGLLELKGSTDCSANPNYPAASAGDTYYVTVAGKIGGASGKSVDVGDAYIAISDNAGGAEAAVGTSWFVLEHNLSGALLSANNLSDLASVATARTNLGATTVGGNLFTATNPSAIRYIRINADNSITFRTAAEILSDIGGIGATTTDTLTNKRITPRVLSAASYTTDTGTSLNCDSLDGFFVTAQAGALLFNNPTGTPTDGQVLLIRVKDSGTARALTYGSQFRGIGSALPSTTTISKTLYLCAVWNAADSKWDTTNSQEV